MATEKQLYHFTAEVKDVEIRKVERIDYTFNNSKGEPVETHYIQLTCDAGDNMDRVVFKDKDVANLDRYKRGMIGTAIIRVDYEEGYGSKTKFTLVDFRESE